MIRRFLLWGLTLILMGAVVYLAIRSQREAAEPPLPKIAEVTQEAKPSLTRVLNPGDLLVVGSDPQAAGNLNSPKETVPPGCFVSFRNAGSLSYCNLQIKLAYFGNTGNSLGTKNIVVKGTIPAGGMLDSGGVFLAEAPAGTAKCEATILSADIGSQEAAGIPAEKDQADSNPKQDGK